MAPQLEFGDYAHLIAEFEQGEIAFRRLVQIESGLLGSAGGRRGETLAADLRDRIHVETCLFHALGADGIVVDDELGEADGAFHSEARRRRSACQDP